MRQVYRVSGVGVNSLHVELLAQPNRSLPCLIVNGFYLL